VVVLPAPLAPADRRSRRSESSSVKLRTPRSSETAAQLRASMARSAVAAHGLGLGRASSGKLPAWRRWGSRPHSQVWGCCAQLLQRQTLLAETSSRHLGFAGPHRSPADEPIAKVCTSTIAPPRSSGSAPPRSPPAASTGSGPGSRFFSSAGGGPALEAPLLPQGDAGAALGLHQIRGGHHDRNPLLPPGCEHVPKSPARHRSTQWWFIGSNSWVCRQSQPRAASASLHESWLARTIGEVLQTQASEQERAAPPGARGHQPQPAHSAGFSSTLRSGTGENLLGQRSQSLNASWGGRPSTRTWPSLARSPQRGLKRAGFAGAIGPISPKISRPAR